MSLLDKINKIKRQYKFKDDYDLYAEITGIEKEYLSEANKYRPKIVQNEAKKKLKHIIALHNLVTHSSISFELLLPPKYSSAVKEMLIDFKSKCDEIINKNKDIGGRTKGQSRQTYYIFRLMVIYHDGTGKPIRCGWSDIYDKGTGDTFKFICELKKEFKIGINEQSIYQNIKNIRKRFKGLLMF